jgi:hypothetical protein
VYFLIILVMCFVLFNFLKAAEAPADATKGNAP